MSSLTNCRRIAVTLSLGLLCVSGSGFGSTEQTAPPVDPMEQDVTQGALRVKKDAQVVECPLKHTDVQVQISGFIGRVKVTQTFYNPYDEKIEAVYVFPLPHKSAVDDMTMVIGERRIVGLIKRRAEARAIYEQALASGAAAALLEQERPNIFTQSVGNIPPKQEVRIEISYVDVLEYDMGTYEFHFPMVVGPRYIPGGATSAIPPVPRELQGKVGELDKNRVPEGPDKPKGTGWAPDTDRVPDASRITPPVLKPGFRNGHDIALAVTLDAGVPIQGLKSPNHEARITRAGESRAEAKLAPADSVPNKDFVLKYDVVGKKPEMAVLAHTEKGGRGYFMLMIQPKEDDQLRKSPPRELVFLVDVSGSMSGEPTEKVKETMAKLLRLCKAQDTVQVITFASQAQKLFESPIPCNADNIRKAVDFTQAIAGSGGTEMLKGVKLAIEEPQDKERMRIVLMLTDGFIGNEAEIIAEVGRKCGDRIRFWCIGIGSSPNRFLLDGVARQGGGMAKVVGLRDDPGETVEEIMTRIHRAQLAKIGIDWGAARVMELYPAKIPELWAGRPVILYGLYENGVETVVNVRGDVEGQAVSWPLKVSFPSAEPANEVLAKVWARNKIEDLMHQAYYGTSPEVEEAVTELALDYRLMSQYTSFVAVDQSEMREMKEPARPPRRMLVAVPLPDGVRYEGIFGPAGEDKQIGAGSSVRFATASRAYAKAPATFAPKFKAVGGSGLPGLLARPTSPQPMPSAAPAAQPAAGLVKRQLSPHGVSARAWSIDSLASYRSGVETEALGAADDSEYSGHAARVLYTQGDEIVKRAEAAFAEAEKLKKAENWLGSLHQFQLAYLLDAAAMSVGRSSGEKTAAAQAGIEEIHKRLVADWSKELPQLQKTLDLVIRDQSVGDSVSAVQKSAGVSIKVIPGSVEDACAVMNRTDLRVNYLDLRHATVAQALDWILVPNRMTWWVSKGSVVVGTVRRSGIESAWVYDVARIAIPCADELKGEKDYNRLTKLYQDAADKFRKMVGGTLGLKNEAISWYGPGQLLIFASPEKHSAAAKLITDLASPEAKVDADLASLHAETSKRAQSGREAAEQARDRAEKRRVIASLDSSGWNLLAAAADGKLDPEALTELQIAWKDAAIPDLLKEPRGFVVLRSLWTISEAARALPDAKEIADLARSGRKAAKPGIEAVLDALKKTPQDHALFLKALYAALVFSDEERFVASAKPLVTSGAEAPQIIAGALLRPVGEINAKALMDLVGAGVQGEDLVVLYAFACRRAGGEAWNVFRANARDLLGNQPLSGGAVVLVNRLSAARLPLLAAAR